ncbi:methylenetetrahydrofolate reductase C-terminal domain-containing protein, partial [Candidatus Bathyarchaeota archaeon]|nr:methylenetetrahydrofolate reductase C-terminal domain-containing protein [Candidatus Bathyarchaeota archaeon]
RCAKGLLNGPCGGMSKGKCEVGGWKKDCAWVLIFNRLKKMEKTESFTKFRTPRDYRVSQTPRELGMTAEEERK